MTEPERINIVLAEHQRSLDGWDLSKTMADLHLWAERIVFAFKLQVPTPAFTIEPLRRRRLGHYCHGRNGFGLADEIALDIVFVRGSPYWRVLGTVAHELLHSWQEHHGKPGKRNYHNRRFREKAKDYGLIIDQYGHTQFLDPPTAFLDLLKEHGVILGEGEIPKLQLAAEVLKPRVGSKLKLWMCPCGEQRARVAKPTFLARCLICNGLFEPAGKFTRGGADG